MILVTAPTSTIGRDLVETLLGRERQVRVITRDPAGLSAQVRERADVVVGSHGDPEVIEAASRGAEAVFWLAPVIRDAPTVASSFADFARPAVGAFARHGVRRVVGISALGRGTRVADQAGLATASLQMDDLFAASEVPYRAVVCASLMRNLLRHVRSIRDERAFFMTLDPERPGPLVTSRDVANRCAELLVDAAWSGSGEVACLGPEDISPNKIAMTISKVVGREIAYRQITGDALFGQLLSTGYSEAMAKATVEMFEAKNRGLDSGVARCAALSNPTTFEQWCRKILGPAVG